MGCLFHCFWAADDESRAGRARAQLVSSSVAPSANPKVGGRRATPFRNMLSAMFLREDEGSQATISGLYRDVGSKRVDPELTHEEISTRPPGGYLRPTTTTTKMRKHEHLPDLLKLDNGLPESRLD